MVVEVLLELALIDRVMANTHHTWAFQFLKINRDKACISLEVP